MNKQTIPERDFSVLSVTFCTGNANWALESIMGEQLSRIRVFYVAITPLIDKDNDTVSALTVHLFTYQLSIVRPS